MVSLQWKYTIVKNKLWTSTTVINGSGWWDLLYLHCSEKSLSKIGRNILHTLDWKKKTFKAFSLKRAAFGPRSAVVSHRRPPGGPAGFQTSRSRCSPAASSDSRSCTPPELQEHGRGIQTCSLSLRNASDILMTANQSNEGSASLD